jgi:glutathione S-transferase
MITLHHCVSARSFRPLWLLEELGLPYTLRLLPFPPRVHARHFLADNPLGTVPLFVDGAVRLTESAAICQYLAARHSPGVLDVPVPDPAYGAYLNWLHMSDATLTFPQTLVLRYTHMEPPDRLSPQVATDYARWFLARLRAVDVALQAHDFLCAGRFTAADVAVGYALLLAEHLGLAEAVSQKRSLTTGSACRPGTPSSARWRPSTRPRWSRGCPRRRRRTSGLVPEPRRDATAFIADHGHSTLGKCSFDLKSSAHTARNELVPSFCGQVCARLPGQAATAPSGAACDAVPAKQAGSPRGRRRRLSQ